MGKVYDRIDEKLSRWLLNQQIFFVATAPLSPNGHINCSPKDGRSFRVLDEQTVAYLDLTGSGVETLAHVKENHRIVLMFCSFQGGPKIVRLHGYADAIEVGTSEFSNLKSAFYESAGTRSIMRIRLKRISDSCGYGVPLYEFQGHRTQLQDWVEHKGEEGVSAYRKEVNVVSIDGLQGIS